MTSAALIGTALVASSGSGMAATPVPPTPQSIPALNVVSGLSWASGSTNYSAEFATWRGRPHDIYTIFSGLASWDTVVKNVTGGWVRNFASRPGRVSLGLAMLTSDTKLRFDRCNAGDFDQYFRTIGTWLTINGLGRSIIRLGWEANGSSYPWSVGKVPDQVEAYKACFRRQVGILRSVAPSLTIEWTMRKATQMPLVLDQLYPGDDVVDVIGLLYYDRYPIVPDQTAWNKAYLQLDKKGGPLGLGRWLQFARSHNKKLALAEWAISDGYADSNAFDNPFFIQKMYEFFRTNAAAIAYESYFNGSPLDTYAIYPTNWNPMTSSKYRELWQLGN
jgi:hypothetical protein